MSQPRPPRHDVARALTRELNRRGVPYHFENGGKHWRLVIDFKGHPETIIVSGSPSDRNSVPIYMALLHRKIGKMSEQSELDLEAGGDAATAVADSRQPIVTVKNGAIFANSRDVAASFGKRHDNVLRDIDALISHSSRLRGGAFIEISIPHPTVAGRRDRAFDMSRDGFALLAMGFTGARALDWKLKYIEAFNAMEAHLRSSTPLRERNDVDAILDLMSEHRAEIVRTHQAGHADLLEHIDSTPKPVLHYLKAFVRGPIEQLAAYMKERFEALHRRDVRVITELEANTRAIGKLLAEAKGEQPFYWSQWYDVARIYAEFFAGEKINRRAASHVVGDSLDSFCKSTGRQAAMQRRVLGGRPTNIWHHDAVVAWLDCRGRELIRRHRIGEPGNVVALRQ